MTKNQRITRPSPSASPTKDHGSLRGRGSTHSRSGHMRTRGGLMTARGGLATNPYLANDAVSSNKELRNANNSQLGNDFQRASISTLSTGTQTENISGGNQPGGSNDANSYRANPGHDQSANSRTNCSALEKRIEALEALMEASNLANAIGEAPTSMNSPAANDEAFEKGVEPFRHSFGKYVLDVRRVTPEPASKSEGKESKPTVELELLTEARSQKDVMDASTEPVTPVTKESMA
ncbi:uncharacterized protein K452DRAFT_321527 [Aplosporella prunicola CBS 121167]|uniref:Uncharacterized protein n=1 Tax=Aplosporella prunicola CBS 121167 TaxID=1176127 RepID=A0A6A6B2L0_9PEZI|nr:uncharacterized protein K452DRAFT_321527 [Aplosporella prunicola CBS 121167]KAF2137828.1 hypothetical protein K452DRAFT_321527 [Aplosporella prunicola CBS 121167]